MLKRPYNHEEPTRYSYIIQACVAGQLLSGEASPSEKQSLRDLTPELLAEMERIGLTRHQVHNRLIKGWPLERAATTPIYGFGGRPAKNAHD